MTPHDTHRCMSGEEPGDIVSCVRRWKGPGFTGAILALAFAAHPGRALAQGGTDTARIYRLEVSVGALIPFGNVPKRLEKALARAGSGDTPRTCSGYYVYSCSGPIAYPRSSASERGATSFTVALTFRPRWQAGIVYDDPVTLGKASSAFVTLEPTVAATSAQVFYNLAAIRFGAGPALYRIRMSDATGQHSSSKVGAATSAALTLGTKGRRFGQVRWQYRWLQSVTVATGSGQSGSTRVSFMHSTASFSLGLRF